LLHPVYFFKNNSVDIAAQHLLVQNGAAFCGFVLYDKLQKTVNAWVLYETKEHLNEQLLNEIITAKDWLKVSFQSVTIVDYTHRNTLVPRQLISTGAEEMISNFLPGSFQNTVALEDAAGEALNLYKTDAAAYVALNKQFINAQWLHHESLVMKQAPAQEPIITVEIWFNTMLLFAQQNGKWLLLQQRTYQTPEDVLYHILNCKQQHAMADDVQVVLRGMVETNSALYQLLHQYILNLDLQQQLVFEYPHNISDIAAHTKTLIDRILTCVL
jgi:hypothetical protein